MRCKACNKGLSDFESTRKVKDTSEYLDLCNKCYKESGLSSILTIQERPDLATEEDSSFEGGYGLGD